MSALVTEIAGWFAGTDSITALCVLLFLLGVLDALASIIQALIDAGR